MRMRSITSQDPGQEYLPYQSRHNRPCVWPKSMQPQPAKKRLLSRFQSSESSTHLVSIRSLDDIDQCVKDQSIISVIKRSVGPYNHRLAVIDHSSLSLQHRIAAGSPIYKMYHSVEMSLVRRLSPRIHV